MLKQCPFCKGTGSIPDREPLSVERQERILDYLMSGADRYLHLANSRELSVFLHDLPRLLAQVFRAGLEGEQKGKE